MPLKNNNIMTPTVFRSFVPAVLTDTVIWWLGRRGFYPCTTLAACCSSSLNVFLMACITYIYSIYVIFLDWTEINIVELPWKSIACVLMRKLRRVSVIMVLLRFLGLLSIETPTELEQQAQTRKWQENRRSGRGEKGGRWERRRKDEERKAHFSDRKRQNWRHLCVLLCVCTSAVLFWITTTSLPEQTSPASGA